MKRKLWLMLLIRWWVVVGGRGWLGFRWLILGFSGGDGRIEVGEMEVVVNVVGVVVREGWWWWSSAFSGYGGGGLIERSVFVQDINDSGRWWCWCERVVAGGGGGA
ncbi:hypothetical protein Hanom_Chr08g00702421 [Helianthus anomalus]